jgi:transposase
MTFRKTIGKKLVERVLELRKQKKSYKEIAIDLKIKRSTVHYIIQCKSSLRIKAKPFRIKPEHVELARTLLEQKVRPAQIGREIGLPNRGNVLYTILRRAGYQPRKPKATPYAMAAAYANGMPITAVARQAGVRFGTVRAACKRHGVPLRPRSEIPLEQILALRHQAGLSFDKIAERVGLCRSSITQRYRRWLEKTNGTRTSQSLDGSPASCSAAHSGS